MICNQKNCTNTAAFRFTWPGRDEAGICDTCAPKLRGVAEALGLPLQLIPLGVIADDLDSEVTPEHRAAVEHYFDPGTKVKP